MALKKVRVRGHSRSGRKVRGYSRRLPRPAGAGLKALKAPRLRSRPGAWR